MKTFPMTCLLLLIVSTSSVARATSLPYFVSETAFVQRPFSEYCMDYFKSSSAKLKEANIERSVVEVALRNDDWIQREQNYIFQSAIQGLAEEKYADHICDSTEFAPTVLSADYQFTCQEICQNCMPGSAPICFLRSPRYAGLAQVCLCTYNLQNPVEEAAFSIRHEKRVFSRKIRRT